MSGTPLWQRAMTWTLLLMGSVAMLFPLWWMVVVSLETPQRAGAAIAGGGAMTLLPPDPQWSNYAEALRRMGTVEWQGFVNGFANSVVVTTLVVVGTVISSSLAGLAFARTRFRGSRLMFLAMLGTMMLPAQVTIIPLFILFRALGWVDSLLPLVVPAFFGSAFFIFMYRQFIAQIPESLIEAARVDGHGWLGIWWAIILPMCRPVTAICVVFTFIWTWNDFMGPLIYLHSDPQMTLPVALNSFRNQYGGLENVHLLMAASLVTMVPCIVLFLSAQRSFIEGLARGAVKG
jgi:multiple sugar transport system permease protein